MTYQRPAYEEVRIAHGGNTVTLRPTLRAAATLEARYGFPALFRALDDLSFTIVSDIILTVANCRDDAAAFLRSEAAGRPLFSFFMAVRRPLAELISMFMPAPDLKAKPSTGSGKPVPWADAYADMYAGATGWLGWTPETAWNSTPTEISRAMSAHFDRLVTTGVLQRTDKQAAKEADPEQAKRNEAAGLDPEFDRDALRAMKMKIASGS
ncbi:hypothetical protein FY136_02620 [Agrobacterium tumefaciens]|uniref:hypothetical protein n=1 Tax=Agrobacterium tumefaciens TaxID=358 RepID=UPI0021D1FF14|nr:hypothetical protein [Agrobacterium tumefaciens]UXT48180.1 hypothetical protein FY136_02620 [Agrobacterium tumefaciens]